MIGSVSIQSGVLKATLNSNNTLKGKLSTSLPDGGYDRGYRLGYTKGHSDGYNEGHSEGYNEGLSARTYETWTFTLVDGTIVEKEVALL